MTPDFSKIRNEFPLLLQQGLTYLDTAASSQKPAVVIDGLRQFYQQDYSNIHRGAHFLADRATEKFEHARSQIAAFIGAANRREIIFTRNATEAINIVARSLADFDLFQPGDRIILTRMEHHANLVPWFQLAEKTGTKIEYLDFDAEKNLKLDRLDELLKPPTKLIAFTQLSNVLGTRTPAEEICKKAAAAGVLTLVDAAQSVPHFAVDVTKIGCDFLVFSAHKIYGPSGVGVLYGKLSMLKKMPPFLGGGEMIREVRYDGFLPNEVPYKFEAGTPAIAEVVGTGIAVEFLKKIGMAAIEQHDKALAEYAYQRLAEINGITIVSNRAAAGLVTFVVAGVMSYDISDFLSDRGICVRVGHHCAEPLHNLLGLKSTVRASFGIYNTIAEVDLLADTLHEALAELSK